MSASTSASRLSMSRWLVGSSRISRCGASKVARPSSSRAFSPPERFADRRVALPVRRSRLAPSAARTFASGCVGHQRAHVIVGGCRSGFELVELVLGEIARPSSLAARVIAAGHRLQAGRRAAWRRSTCRCRWRRAARCGRRGRCAGSGRDSTGLLGRSRRRRRPVAMIGGDSALRRRRESERRARSSTMRRDRLQLRQHLEARLRLARLGGLGAEAVDEGLQVLALRLLLLRAACLSSACCSRRWRSKLIVAAAVERQLAAVEVEDRVDRAC